MKSIDRILAKRYARAFDALSPDGESARRACGALCAAAQVLAAAEPFMAAPSVPSAQKKAFVSELFGGDKAVAGFLCTLLDAKRYRLLDACVQEVSALADERLGIVRADVQTAFELTQEQKKRVEEALGRFTGKKALVQFTSDPALLGGLRARLGDVLIDGTLKRQFEKLQEELTK